MKVIKNNPNYLCDRLGNIYTKGPKGNSAKADGSIRFLKPYKKHNGYLCVKFGKKHHHVHRLILSTWTYESKLECNHINGNKIDNRLENLEWVTKSQNMLHSTRVLGQKPGVGENSYCNKLLNKDVIEIRRLRSKGWTFEKIAKKYNMNRSWIYRVATKESWKHV